MMLECLELEPPKSTLLIVQGYAKLILSHRAVVIPAWHDVVIVIASECRTAQAQTTTKR